VEIHGLKKFAAKIGITKVQGTSYKEQEKALSNIQYSQCPDISNPFNSFSYPSLPLGA
jgi:hypothetical protein